MVPVKLLMLNLFFLGAGGGALPLLQKAEVEESKGFGGFPVSGQWLVCEKPELVEQHFAKSLRSSAHWCATYVCSAFRYTHY